MSLKHTSHKADVDLRIWVKGSSPIRMAQDVSQAGISSQTLDVGVQGWPYSAVPHPGRSTEHPLICSANGGVIPGSPGL